MVRRKGAAPEAMQLVRALMQTFYWSVQRSWITKLSKPCSSFETLHTRRGASQMRQVHKNDDSEMTGRQEGTVDRGCRDCSKMFNSRIYKNARFLPSGALSCAVSIFSQPSHPMAFTHVYRAMAPLTVIPYKPKLQKPSNHNVHCIPSKPFVRQPSSLTASQGIDSGESSASASSLLARNAENCGAAAGNAVCPGDDPKSARGMRSDYLFHGNRLSLTISRTDGGRNRVTGEK
jgi:hypothetical protein